MDTEFNPVIHARLPRRIMRLEQLAYNLWWSWNRNARDLFKRMDRTLWTTSRHNPVKMLIETSAENLAVLAKDPTFLRQYDAVMMEMDRDLGNGHHWFAQTYPELAGEKIAYLSAEFGLHTSMPIYSGGLGILSGDHNKEASDLGLPFIGVGFLYEQGYFSQRLDPSGWQESIYTDLRQEEVALLPVLCKDGTCIRVNVTVGDREVALQVWEVLVGRARLYLMDANVEENAPWDRELTARLYGGDREMRLQQEILLGIGGVKIIRMLDLKPAVWHLNEGHSAFMVLERLKEYVAQGMPWNEAIEHIRAGTVFTTHTPVPAGHDTFSFSQIERYFHTYWSQLGISRDEFMALGSYDNGYGVNFNMTALAMRMSGRINGVSALHGEVSRRMWRTLWPDKAADATPIGHVTNGVHLASWTGEAMHRIYRQYISPDWLSRQDEPMLWERIEDVPDQVLWDAHVYLKNKLFSAMRERARQSRMQQQASPEHLLASGILLDPDALVIGFARRFATYKRAGLIFRDLERLKALIHHRYRPVQFVFAGKAHPADDPGKRLLQELHQWARSAEMGGRIAFVEDYDMHIARYLVQGVDVWMNTPRKPMEASGTSGMKAAFNGIPNLSILDGWWAEAYNGRNGWAIQSDLPDGAPEWEQDKADAEALYRVLEDEVVPLYYQRSNDNVPQGWVATMKDAIRTVGPMFSTRRMIKEYTQQYYVPSIREIIEIEGDVED
ncbi:MAG: Glycogen phosphorylase [Chloroflexi bacterium ADurb.Bin360]|nr:MAG: Glycogen phosphorylase [Chloroflexi bacterium ADurb.Bin360]